MKNIKSYRNKADQLWFEVLKLKHPQCEVCGAPTQQIHHFFAKGSCSHLRYGLDNGVGLCMHCHSLLHFRDAKLVESKIIERRGQQWYDKLLLKARERPTSFARVNWYKEHIELLNKIYNNL
jgi:5-methylcytosine-specific restriction endonuclease McrA